MLIGGLDIGTSGCKITVYNEKGDFIEKQYREYASKHAQDVHEIDAEAIYQAVGDVISSTVQKPEVLGVTSFGETFVLVDENDRVLCDSMLYTDPRGDAECAVFDSQMVKKITYCAPHGMYSLPKLVWIRKNRPDLYERTKHIFLIQDYILYMLTGNACIDYSLAARTMGLDIRRRVWSEEIFAAAGIDPAKMSKPVESGAVVGTSCAFGLPNARIIAGGHDQVASAIGAGALENGTAVDGSGSVECITPVFSRLPESEEICDSGYAFVPFPGDQYVCYAFSFTGGTALKWYRDQFAPESSYRELDAGIRPDPSGILTVPHFAGAATPYMDAGARAVFAGITLETTPADLYRSIMEGVAYEMKVNLERLSTYGICPNMLFATGGGAKSQVWLQMKADILGLPITAIDAPEVGTLGTVMLAAVAVGMVSDLQGAKALFVKEGKTFYPDSGKGDAYRELYEKYVQIYTAAKNWR